MWASGGKKPPAIVLPITAPMDFKCVALRGPGTEDYSNSTRQHTAVALVYWQMRPWGQECKDDTKHTEIRIKVGPLGTDTAQFGFLSPTELHFVFQSLSQSPSLDLAFLDHQLPDTAPFPGPQQFLAALLLPLLTAAVILSTIKTIFPELFHLVSWGLILFLGNLIHKHTYTEWPLLLEWLLDLFIITSLSPAA